MEYLFLERKGNGQTHSLEHAFAKNFRHPQGKGEATNGDATTTDVTAVNGNSQFEEAVGVDISECTSAAAIADKIQAAEINTAQASSMTRRLQQDLKKRCVICSDEDGFPQAVILLPCFHVICEVCLPKMQSCPFDKQNFVGTIDLLKCGGV